MTPRRFPPHRALRCALLAGLAAAAAGCQTTPGRAAGRTTRFQPADIVIAADEVAQQFAQSPFLRSRGSDAPLAVIQPGRTVNRSSDRLSPVDRYGAIARVLTSQEMLDLLRAKNVAVQMAPEQAVLLERYGFEVPPPTMEPTHVLEASFGSIVRAAEGRRGLAEQRRETFLIDYRLVEVDSRRIVWQGQQEFTRYAYGLLAD